MGDTITINTSKLFAMLAGLVFAAGAAGAGVGAAVGVNVAAPASSPNASASAADRAALKADQDAFRKEVRETLAALKESGRGGPSVEEISQGILRAFAALDGRSRDKNRKDAEAGEAYLKSLSRGTSK
ncbi:MAG: hypothetical protein LCH93_16720 [Proteobacteria bacterium]|nr:hypothetical protein [Pseudomonadota bacterium]